MMDKINTAVEELFVCSSLLEALTLAVTHFRYCGYGYGYCYGCGLLACDLMSNNIMLRFE
jgi:hypothetical protein